MTKEDVDRLYKIWMFHRSIHPCDCEDHHPSRKKVCAREQAWRNYVYARDKLLGPYKEREDKIVDLDALFDTFDGMPEN